LKTTMQTESQNTPVSKKVRWVGYILSALPALLFAFSATMKLLRPPEVLKGFTHLGYPEHLALALGILELACTIIYVIPRTSILGAILLTGFLGGAIASHVRIGEPVITHVILGVMIWAGLFLRDRRLRVLIPFRT